jgi:hypothetical protein
VSLPCDWVIRIAAAQVISSTAGQRQWAGSGETASLAIIHHRLASSIGVGPHHY